MLAATALLLAIGLTVGVVPSLANGIGHAAAVFADPTGYRAAVLGGLVGPAAPVPAEWTLEGLLGIVSTVAALGFALVPLRFTAFGRLNRPLAALHRIHSGHVGDYVATLLLGVAAVTAAIAVG
jgi:multicomponent Na+:H+ antiporter subunit D